MATTEMDVRAVRTPCRILFTRLKRLQGSDTLGKRPKVYTALEKRLGAAVFRAHGRGSPLLVEHSSLRGTRTSLAFSGHKRPVLFPGAVRKKAPGG